MTADVVPKVKPAAVGDENPVSAVEPPSSGADPSSGEPHPKVEPPTSVDLPSPGYARPVMIHRAIYGSFERFIAILTEHFAGKWPFWLSPRQILVIPVMPAVKDYVLEVQSIFRAQTMYVDVDLSGNTMQKKIRTGQLQQYNFIFGTPWWFFFFFFFFFFFSPLQNHSPDRKTLLSSFGPDLAIGHAR